MPSCAESFSGDFLVGEKEKKDSVEKQQVHLSDPSLIAEAHQAGFTEQLQHLKEGDSQMSSKMGGDHVCCQCDASFDNEGDLTEHALRHSRRLPYKCYMCSKSFLKASVLQRHFIFQTQWTNK